MLGKIKKIVKKKLIKFIVWDFDDTLYVNEKVGVALKKGYRDYLNKNLKKKISAKDFNELSEKHGGWSKAASKLLKKPELKIINDVEKKVNKSRFLKRNNALVKQVESLKNYKHIILTNTPQEELSKCLKKVGFKYKNGLDYYPFEKIIDCNAGGAPKPNLKSFKKVLEYTNTHPKRLLMIGDSYTSDIKPAKTLGFQTIHVDRIQEILDIKLKNK